jgi:hypothetical protein
MGRFGAAAAFAILLAACDSGPASEGAASALVEEQLAYHVGVIAYLYGYPMVDMYRRMHNETHRVSPDQSFYAPVNTLAQVDDHTWAGWLDVREGSVTLSVRGAPGLELLVHSTNFDGLSAEQRLQISGAGTAKLEVYADHGSDEGSGSHSVTPFAYLRVSNAGQAGSATVELEAEVPSTANAGARVVPLDPMRSLGYFEVLNLLLMDTEFAAGDERLFREFNNIGVGPGVAFSQAELSPARKRGLERAIRDARAMLEAAGSGYDADNLLGRAASYERMIIAAGLSRENLPAADSR